MRIRAWLIFTAVWACGTGAYAEAPALNRWAILATPQVQESGLADLLTAELGKEPGLTLVERDQIAAALKELTLDQALGAEATGQRLKLGKLLKADALLFLAEEQHEKDEFIRGVVSDSALGARLSTDFLPLATGGGGEARRADRGADP